MTEDFFGYLVYSTMLFAVIALLWSKRHLIQMLLFKMLLFKKALPESTNEYDIIRENKAVQFALNWKDENQGTKQDESVFRENGKRIAKSKTYKSAHKEVFELN
jgi:hypothetical protein